MTKIVILVWVKNFVEKFGRTLKGGRPRNPEEVEIGSHDFAEKVQILDAIRENYDFEKTFKRDYKMIKDNGSDNKAKLFYKNLKILNQYAKMRGIMPENLFGKSNHEWFKKNIDNFDQKN